MNFLDVPQGRALAIILPSVTLMAHAASFAVLKSVFAESWGSSFAATYDLFAAAASAMGLLGALQRRRVLLATYLIAHAVTLSLISAILLINVLPTAITLHFPFASYVRYDQTFGIRVCKELDTGFGSDERWLKDCASSLDTLAKGAMWAGVVLMAAQWVVLLCIGSWVRDRPSVTRNEYDVEKRPILDIGQEYKR